MPLLRPPGPTPRRLRAHCAPRHVRPRASSAAPTFPGRPAPGGALHARLPRRDAARAAEHTGFAPTHAPPSTGASAVSLHAALLPSALESHPSSTHVASEHAPCTLGCGVGTVPTSVGVGLGCGVTSSPSLGRGGVARLPAGRPVHACTSAQHRMHAAVEVAASMHKKAVRALLLVARETHLGNKGGTSFAAGMARPQVLAVARGARSTPR